MNRKNIFIVYSNDPKIVKKIINNETKRIFFTNNKTKQKKFYLCSDDTYVMKTAVDHATF